MKSLSPSHGTLLTQIGGINGSHGYPWKLAGSPLNSVQTYAEVLANAKVYTLVVVHFTGKLTGSFIGLGFLILKPRYPSV